MLGGLLKHEFRATGRTMLPVYGAVVILAVLANFSIRFLDVVDNTLLTILFTLIIIFFVVGIIAAAIMTAVVMIRRFYRNLLRDEGYLMHTLPVSVHGLVWSKLIVSLVWFIATFLVIWLVILLTGLIQSGTSLGEIFAGAPSWEEIRSALAEFGVQPGQVSLIGVEMLAMSALGGLTTCLHFYAAMALGHMFAKDKVLLSIVFFVVISFVFNLLSSGYGMVSIEQFTGAYETLETVPDSLRFAQSFLLRVMLLELVQAALLYLATVLGLKRGLNLA